MRKTALDDDASIYQKAVEETERQKWERMDKSQRWQYFLDYYLVKLIVIVFLAALVCFLAWSIIRPKEETLLYVAVIDEQMEEEKKAELTEELNRLYQADGKKQQVVVDDMFYTQGNALEKLQVYMYNHQIDVIIADQDTYRKLAGYGFFQDMESFEDRDGVSKYQDKYLSAAGYQDTEEVSFEDHETGQGEPAPYGIDISGSDKFNRVKNNLEKPVLAVAAGAPNEENAIRFLDFIMEEESEE